MASYTYRHKESGQEWTSSSRLTRYEESEDWESITGAGSGPGAGPPAPSATRAAWDEYATAQGLDPSEYSSKEELQAALEGGAS
jgi:hypothetical protein